MNTVVQEAAKRGAKIEWRVRAHGGLWHHSGPITNWDFNTYEFRVMNKDNTTHPNTLEEVDNLLRLAARGEPLWMNSLSNPYDTTNGWIRRKEGEQFSFAYLRYEPFDPTPKKKKPPRKLLTGTILLDAGACSEGVDDFEEVFPDGTVGDPGDIEKAIDANLDFAFFQFWCLAENGLINYDQRDAIEKQRNQAYDHSSDRDRETAKLFFEFFNK